MLRRSILAALVASLFAAGAAFAETAAPTIAQLRLAGADRAVDAFLQTSADGAVLVQRDTLSALGLTAPASAQGDWIALQSISGLHVTHDDADAAYVLSCDAECYRLQHVDAAQTVAAPPLSTGKGFYLNYDVESRWADGKGAVAAIGEFNVFGPWGLVENSWSASTGEAKSGVTRLETRWTLDDPQRRMRLRFGDSVATSLSGAPFRFAGVQFGSAFDLTPEWITFPTPAFSGVARSPSTVELYIDDALRARQSIDAGPFQVDDAPVVDGAGQARLVVTDIFGRQQVISQPFLVNTALLRPSLSDWQITLGAPRKDYGVQSFRYGAAFGSASYRVGVTDALTVGAVAISGDDASGIEVSADVGGVAYGRLHIGRAQSADGGASSAAWTYDAHAWSVGADFEQRDHSFDDIGDQRRRSQSAAAHFSLVFDDFGLASLTVARLQSEGAPADSIVSVDFSTNVGRGALNLRASYIGGERDDFAVGISFTAQLRGGVTGSASANSDRRGVTYAAALSNSADPSGGYGWRAAVATGRTQRLEAAANLRSAYGDTLVEAQSVNGVVGVRGAQTGSIGWLDGAMFAGPRLDGAFAIVDAGAPDVAIYRDGLRVARTGADGRALAANLQPYAVDRISINVDDLPLDRGPASADVAVRLRQGSGALVRFADAAERIADMHVAFADGGAPPRGAVLTRSRDGARFPIGADGRIALMGARRGDVLTLDITPACRARFESADAALTLQCGAT